jgi:hypothetical protein
MNIQITEKTRTATSRCTRDFSCQERGGRKPCPVTECVLGEVIFIECQEPYCTYRLNYADAQICTCPTRKELYLKHSI